MISRRRALYTIATLIGLIALFAVALAAMPWGLFRPGIENRLSAQFGRPVTVGYVDRLDTLSFTPTIRLRDVRVPQAAWAGKGDLASIESATVEFPVFPLLLGRFRPSGIDAAGVRLTLVRDAGKRVNWNRSGQSAGNARGLSLKNLVLSDTIVEYRDAAQARAFRLDIASDQTGLRARGPGTVRGKPVTVEFSAPRADTGENKPWPFRADIRGAALTMAVRGTMDRPLDIRHMAIDVDAKASDLKMIDAIIEAGLFGTQAVNLSAHARRDGGDWRIDRIRGTIGRSNIAGALTVTKVQGRTKLKGAVTSNALDFDDFASDDGLARAAVLEQTQGIKLIPNTRVNLGKITGTDGSLAFDIRHVIGGKRPSSFTSLTGQLDLNRQVLVVSPLRIGLKKGAITGSVKVDQREGGPVPLVTLDLRLADSSIGAVAGGGDTPVDARLDGRVRLAGPGSTIREAVGRSNGSFGLSASNGALPARIAALIGFDIARGLTTGKQEVATLRCAVARFAVRGGRAVAAPFVIDTSLSQSNGRGTITFPSEFVALILTGAPKQASALRLPGSVTLTGTLRAPRLDVPAEVKSAGNILRGIGRAIAGRQGPQAQDADCGALSSAALR